jgi:hypothetical protein
MSQAARTEHLFGLEDFARNFLRDINHHGDVRTEHLAEAFREYFGLPPLPSLADLYGLCRRLGVEVGTLPPGPSGLLAVNVWYDSQGPAILMEQELTTKRAETTLGHELREVLENAFKLVKPSYVGLDTRDNKKMDPESECFAGCLLMQAQASRERLHQLGYDVATFSMETGRSLPSVILRAQQLFPSGSESSPVAGMWLFEAPWGKVRDGSGTADSLKLRYRAHLSGFSIDKGGSASSKLAHLVFPSRSAAAGDFRLSLQCLADRRPVVASVSGFDLFGQHDYLVAAEPFFAVGVPWRVLMTAVRRDCEHLVAPYIRRLGVRMEARTYQSV